MTKIGANDKKKKNLSKVKRPFFSISVEAIDSIASLEDPLALLISYVIICGGVDNKKPLGDGGFRFSTHAERSISERSEVLKYSQIKNSIGILCDKKFICDKRPKNLKFLPGEITFEIPDDPQKIYINISNEFLNKLSSRNLKEKNINKLSELLDNCRATYDECVIGIFQARLDALILFFKLLKIQDFSKYSGVDPRIFSERMNSCTESEVVEEFSIYPSIDERDGWSVVFSRLNTADVVDLRKMSTLLENVWCYEGTDATLLQRCHHAFLILKKSKLIYDSYVLWSFDPIINFEKKITGDEIVSNIYLSSPSDKVVEIFSIHEIDNLLMSSGLVGRSDIWVHDPVDGKSKFAFSNTNVYRYLVPNRFKNRWCILRQIRVRCWSSAQNDVVGMQEDAKKTESYLLDIRNHFLGNDG
ncbi:hypothetical protein [Comamonas testosteroni]|uniref:hypothetical protein n=1 Tax=Comamonas testosteroni TaxID=285 RepID=UPI00391BF854